ncbi:hypothetical protein T01_11609 [Trichinella spiralis]|uniref:Uncharacterized protein n=1 Tax=Trichinella spiralis TaxID=6334 RepID=A0A0V1AQG5_TRISP|nr:hypothetical protein T01_11609 [Trichinella spiralis]
MSSFSDICTRLLRTVAVKHMPGYAAVVSVPPILDFEIVGRPSLSVFTLTHCTRSRKRRVEGVDCSRLVSSVESLGSTTHWAFVARNVRNVCKVICSSESSSTRTFHQDYTAVSRSLLIALNTMPCLFSLSCSKSRAALSLATLVSMLSISNLLSDAPQPRMDPKSPRIVERLQCKLSCRTRRSYLSSSSTRRCMTRNLATSSSNSTIASDLSSSEMPSSRSCCELKQGCFVCYKALDTSQIASVSVTLVHQCVHAIISELYVAVAGSNPAQRTKNMLENPSDGT